MTYRHLTNNEVGLRDCSYVAQDSVLLRQDYAWEDKRIPMFRRKVLHSSSSVIISHTSLDLMILEDEFNVFVRNVAIEFFSDAASWLKNGNLSQRNLSKYI